MRALGPLLLALASSGCGHLGYDPNDASRDSAVDGGVDGGVDSGVDSGIDASIDASVDAGIDACVANGPDLCNGVDDDCDQATPDGAGEPTFGDPCDGPDADLCAEGSIRCDGVALSCDDVTGDAVEICGNGVDDDCAGGDAPADVDGDGERSLACGGTDCDDLEPLASAAGTEGPPGDPTCGDAIDNDCDGLVDAASPGCGCEHPVVQESCAGGWCVIPAGCFFAGSPADENCRTASEDRAAVGLSRVFEIAQSEVTQAQYEAAMADNPSRNDGCGGDCPVERVSWHDAAAYCNALSTEAGLPACYSCVRVGQNLDCAQSADYPDGAVYDCPGYRLPTEAEWEYAARAGTTAATPVGDLADCRVDPALDTLAWYADNAGSSTHPACGLDPNGWGLCDMLGNVAEWTHDQFVDNRGTGAQTDPVFPPAGDAAARGGSLVDFASQVRSADRYYGGQAGQSFDSWGFRCVRTLEPR